MDITYCDDCEVELAVIHPAPQMRVAGGTVDVIPADVLFTPTDVIRVYCDACMDAAEHQGAAAEEANAY